MYLVVYLFINLVLILSYNTGLVCPKRIFGKPEMLKEFLVSKFGESGRLPVNTRQAVSEDEVVQALRQVGVGDGVTRIPSTRFLLDVYQRLTKGEDLQNAAGYSNTDSRLIGADTLRGLRTLGRFK